MMEGWIQLWYTVRTFINVTMCSQYNDNKNKLRIKCKNNRVSSQTTVELTWKIIIKYIYKSLQLLKKSDGWKFYID
jgi:hypothetical protein